MPRLEPGVRLDREPGSCADGEELCLLVERDVVGTEMGGAVVLTHDAHLSRKERGEDGAPSVYAGVGLGSRGRVMEKVVPCLGP